MAIQLVGTRAHTRQGTTGTWTVAIDGLSGGLASAPAADDLVLIFYGVSDITTRTLAGTGYTTQGTRTAADDADATMAALTKVMGATPDTTAALTNSGALASSVAVALVTVWRGVDATTAMDVTLTSAGGANSNVANPPAITPTTAGAVILSAATAAYMEIGASSPYTFTSSDFDTFLTAQDKTSGASAKAGSLGVGIKAWTSGAFDPAAFGGTTTAVTDSWVAISLALRPAATGGVTGAHAATLALGAASTGAVEVAGAHAAAFVLGAVAAGLVAISGQGATTFGLSTAGTGTVAVAGAHAGAPVLASSAAGTVAVVGQHAGAFALGRAASGAVAVAGQHSGAFALASQATGSALGTRTGTHAATFPLAAAATGAVAVAGAASQGIALGASATGAVSVTGQGAATFALATLALGATAIAGQGATTLAIMAEGAGAVAIAGTSSRAFLLGHAASGVLVPPPVPAPPERTIVFDAESRVIGLPAESRTIIIAA